MRVGLRQISFSLSLLSVIFLFSSCSLMSRNSKTDKSLELVNQKGWQELLPILIESGFEREEALALLIDPRMPSFTNYEFKLKPVESKDLYKGVSSKKRLSSLEACYLQHSQSLKNAEERFGVSDKIVVSILEIESGCGKNSGKEVLFYRLARLANAGNASNIEFNILKNINEINPDTNKAYIEKELNEKFKARGDKLRSMFVPELKAVVELAKNLGVHPLEVKGSYGGALGYFQFLPSNVLKLGVDGSGDGKVDPYNIDDAIFSIANYFKHHGWSNNLTVKKQREVVWAYNHSDAYIDSVLFFRDHLDLASRKKPRKEKPVNKKLANKKLAKKSQPKNSANNKLEKISR